jgi:Ni,Fe-hydrogenase III large subunit/Ni,Fe-hydrogenase III component G
MTMTAPREPSPLAPLDGPLPIRHGIVDAAGWSATAASVAASGGRLVALWGTDRGGEAGAVLSVHAAFADADGLAWIELPLGDGPSPYPDLAGLFPYAARMQRATFDLVGISPAAAEDPRPWLDHGNWPRAWHPLRRDAAEPQAAVSPALPSAYPFVRVEGDGVHEIPVGPVHAGIIEPGHFRFSIVGEKVLRLEERLGYVHKGIERRFSQLGPDQGARLAARVSGDSTVAYGLAYCSALESALEVAVPVRAVWLRAVALERERVANHLGDLGALGNDAALAVGLAQFSRLREDWQRLSASLFGHRLMMDYVVPGGVARDLGMEALDAIRRQCAAVAREVADLRSIYDEHAGLQDRFMTTGLVPTDLARRLGATGLAARASGIPRDLRADHPVPPYDTIDFRVATRATGDVAARVAVRFDEVFESMRLLDAWCERLPGGHVQAATPAWSSGARGMGWVEAWRGEILVALEIEPGPKGEARIGRCHPHDPSWQNWAVLEHAIIGNIVPDFPLINKSFNLSYSGHDL